MPSAGRGRSGAARVGCPAAGIALLAGPLDATLDLVNAAEILLEPLTVREGEPLTQRLGVFEHRIDDAAVAAVAVGAEELVERQRRTRLGPGRRHRRAPGNVRAVEQGMPVLESRNRSFAAEHQRRDSRAVANPLSHQLVETDARADFGLRQRRSR